MPPRSPRKASTSGRDAARAAAQSATMPPPPNPAPPQGILEEEVNALSSSLRSAVVKTGQVYEFYADAQRLGINRYAPHPPRSLTSALGREVEKYDQLCDAMESHLHHAIAVLQRDLKREEQRLKAEAEATNATADPPALNPSSSTPPVSPSQSTVSSGISIDSKPPIPIPVRRQSTVSLSSLQRPPFPHKLDLSSSSLRLNPDEILASGLSSPVTLAPKSSHRAIPQELVMAALDDAASRRVDIDLTAGDSELGMHASGAPSTMTLDPSLGSSADKPIELDLDMDVDMFEVGASRGTDPQAEEFFSPPPGPTTGNNQSTGAPPMKLKEEEDLFLNALNAVGDSGDIFASLNGNSLQSSSKAGTSSVNLHPPSPTKGIPSPASLLASFNASSSHSVDPSAPSNEVPFDLNGIDLSNFSSFFGEHPAEPGITASEMENLFTMGESEDANKEGKAP